MIEIARMMTFGIASRKELIGRLMVSCDAFKNLSFADAAQQYRYYERNGLVKNNGGYIVIYHDCD